MSRPFTKQETLHLNPTGYSDMTFTSSYAQNPQNGCNSSANTSDYARFTMRNTGYTIFYDFDSIVIPNTATINSVSCTVRGYVSSSRRYPSLQLYTGTTGKGSATNITSTTTGNTQPLTVGTWTVSELLNPRLRVKVEATGNNYYFYFYGATLSVTYTLSGTEYEIILENTSSISEISPNETQWISSGNSLEAQIYVVDSENIVFTDNDSVQNSNLVLYEAGQKTTPTIVPNQLVEFVSYNNQISGSTNGCTNANSTSCVEINLRSQTSGAYMIHSFNIPKIPKSAVINSVQCQVKASVSSTSTSITNKSVQLYSSSTPKGTAYTNITTSTTVFSLSTGNNWDPEEFNDLKIKISASYGNASNYRLSFYGASLTIIYTINNTFYCYELSNINQDHHLIVTGVPMIKQNGQFQKYTKLYKKYEGTWKRELYFNDAFDTNGIYILKN